VAHGHEVKRELVASAVEINGASWAELASVTPVAFVSSFLEVIYNLGLDIFTLGALETLEFGVFVDSVIQPGSSWVYRGPVTNVRRTCSFHWVSGGRYDRDAAPAVSLRGRILNRASGRASVLVDSSLIVKLLPAMASEVD
jgi:hypothetical protein